MLYGLLRTTDYHKGIADTWRKHQDPCARCVHAELRLRSNRRSAGDLLRRGGVGEEEGGDAEDGEDEGGVLGLAVLGRLVHGAHLLPVDPASEAGRDACVVRAEEEGEEEGEGEGQGGGGGEGGRRAGRRWGWGLGRG